MFHCANKIALIGFLCFLFLGLSETAIANKCRINKSNIYALNKVDTTCKHLILPDFEAEEGEDLDFACTIDDLKGSYAVDHDSIVIFGDVRMTHSKDLQNSYKIKTKEYYGRTKSFRINKTAKIHVTIENLKFIFKDKKLDQVRIACEYNV